MDKIQEKEPLKVTSDKYGSETGSSKVVLAEGIGTLARRILQDATQHNIQVLQNEELLKRLSNLDLLVEIPPELQPAIEEILKYLNKMDLQQGMDSR